MVSQSIRSHIYQSGAKAVIHTPHNGATSMWDQMSYIDCRVSTSAN